jgi:hypothetical protein
MTARLWCLGVALGFLLGPDALCLPSERADGFAAVSGVVLTTDEPRLPVRRAIVSVTGSDRDVGHHAITDDNGEFEISALPAGRYRLAAKRSGFVTIAYGASRPEWPGTDLALSAGQRQSGLTLALARGAVIAGTVRDDSGSPAVDLEVQIERRTATGELYQRFTRTDSQGSYRLFGLPLGSYVVSVKPLSTGTAVTYSGSDAEVDAILQQLRAGRMSAAPTSTPGMAEARPSVSDYTRVYYPGVFTGDDATAVVLGAGEERAGIDLALTLMATARLTGRVVASGGSSTTGTVILSRLSKSSERGRTAGVRGDGTFEFSAVPSGRYQLVTFRPMTGDAAVKCEFASAEVHIASSQPPGVILALKPCLKIAGRIEVSADASAEASRASLMGTQVRLELDRSVRQPMDTELPLLASIGANSTFELGGTLQRVVPGAFILSTPSAGGSSGAWWLQAARTAEGLDVLDSPLVLTENSPEMTNLVLTFTDRHTSLSGSLVTAAGRPAVDYTIIAFTTNRDWWRQPFRRVLTSRPATDGGYKINDLPPGDYYVAALAEVAPNEWLDAAFLEQTVTAAVRVTIGPGEKQVQSLQIRGR